MYNTSSGRFRHYMQVMNKEYAAGPRGEVETYVQVFDCRCNVMLKSGKQLNDIGVVLTENMISVLMRYDARLDDSHYILWGDKYYEVQNFVPDERDRDMMVIAKRISQ